MSKAMKIVMIVLGIILVVVIAAFLYIKSFLSMMDDKERKARYINDLLKVFKTFFNYLEKEGHIKERPTV